MSAGRPAGYDACAARAAERAGLRFDHSRQLLALQAAQAAEWVQFYRCWGTAGMLRSAIRMSDGRRRELAELGGPGAAAGSAGRALELLAIRLSALWGAAGRMPVREVAAAVGRTDQQVELVLTGAVVPTWGLLAALVGLFAGVQPDEGTAQLWECARAGVDGGD